MTTTQAVRFRTAVEVLSINNRIGRLPVRRIRRTNRFARNKKTARSIGGRL